MINLSPIHKKVQNRINEKMKALGRDTVYSDSQLNELTQQEMLTRSTFIKMVSDQEHPVILMGGEMVSGGTTDSDGNPILGFGGDHIAGGLDEIYGARLYTNPDPNFGELNPGENLTKRPMPGIKSIDVSFKGGMRSNREATINWTCWSFEEINRLKPHFLAMGNTVLLEWGWIYNKDSIIDLPTFIDPDEGIKRTAFKNYIDEVVDGKGDFDMMTGTIKNFEFTTRADGAFDCQTILSSVGVSIIDVPTPNTKVDASAEALNTKGEQDKEKLKKLYEEASTKEILVIKPTLTLKKLLENFNDYLHEQTVTDKYKSNVLKHEAKVEEQIDAGARGRTRKVTVTKPYNIRWAPNKYVVITTEKKSPSGEEVVDAWVRWGWFEDNVLSKFLSLCSDDGSNKDPKPENVGIVTEFRSIELGGPERYRGRKKQNQLLFKKFPHLKGKSFDTRKTAWEKNFREAAYESSRLRNSKYLETTDVKNYILPGQFYPQEKDEKSYKNIKLEGDEELLLMFAKLVNEKFPSFATSKSKKQGFLRNMLINTSTLSKCFGSGEGTEAVSIGEALQSLFVKLNSDVSNYWNFSIESDQVETHRVKIVDSSITLVDFDKPLAPQRTDFSENRYGIFFFPVWSHNSIVKTQNITSKVADGMALMMMYGASIDSYKYPSGPPNVGDKAGLLVGGLSNRYKDRNKQGLDFAIKKQKFFKLGNEDGYENDPILINGSDGSLKEYLSSDVIGSLRDSVKPEESIGTSMKSWLGFDPPTPPPDYYGNTGIGYNVDKSMPPPPLKYLSTKQKEELFAGAARAANQGGPGKKAVQENLNAISSLYGSKFDGKSTDGRPQFIQEGKGKLKEEFVNSMRQLIANYEPKSKDTNEALMLPLELELSIDGTGAIYPGHSYHSTYLPSDYQEKTVFQMFDVNHVVDSNGWTTNIRGKMRTTYNQVFDKLKTDKEDILTKAIKNYQNKISADTLTKGFIDADEKRRIKEYKNKLKKGITNTGKLINIGQDGKIARIQAIGKVYNYLFPEPTLMEEIEADLGRPMTDEEKTKYEKKMQKLKVMKERKIPYNEVDENVEFEEDDDMIINRGNVYTREGHDD